MWYLGQQLRLIVKRSPSRASIFIHSSESHSLRARDAIKRGTIAFWLVDATASAQERARACAYHDGLHSYAPCTRRRRGVRSTQIFPTWRQSQFIFRSPICSEIRARRALSRFPTFPKSPARREVHGSVFSAKKKTLRNYFSPYAYLSPLNLILFSIFFFSSILTAEIT